MNIAWDITGKCNLNCIHCYNARNYSEGSWNSNDLTTSEIASILQKLKGNRVEQIQFLGGEPFIRTDFVDILHMTKNTGIQSGIATNGIPLNDDKIAMLADLEPHQIAFSLDGSHPTTNDYIRGTGTFQKAVENVKKLSNCLRRHKSKTRLGIQFTINRYNIGDIDAIIELAKTLKLHFVSFDVLKVMWPKPQTNDKLSHLTLRHNEIIFCLDRIANIMAMEKDISITILNFGISKARTYINSKYDIELGVGRGCPACSQTMYIRADGTVFPCNYASDFPDEILPNMIKKSVLNFKELSFVDVVDSEYFKSFYYYANSGEVYQRLKFCKSCTEYNVCNPCPLDVLRWGEKTCSECIEFDKYLNNMPKDQIVNGSRKDVI